MYSYKHYGTTGTSDTGAGPEGGARGLRRGGLPGDDPGRHLPAGESDAGRASPARPHQGRPVPGGSGRGGGGGGSSADEFPLDRRRRGRSRDGAETAGQGRRPVHRGEARPEHRAIHAREIGVGRDLPAAPSLRSAVEADAAASRLRHGRGLSAPGGRGGPHPGAGRARGGAAAPRLAPLLRIPAPRPAGSRAPRTSRPLRRYPDGDLEPRGDPAAPRREATMKSRRSLIVTLGLALLAIAGGAGFVAWRARDRTRGIVLSGTVETRDVQVGSLVGGRVIAVHVDEGATGKAGQTPVTLEPDLLDPRIRRRPAKGQA